MASTSQQYCLRWNNHRSNLLTVFDELLRNEAFTDVTLAVDGGASVKCHKMVLAACSSYFQSLFVDLPCKHPIVVLKDVKYAEIKAILEYMYRGEVNVAQEQLGGLLKVAEVLKVKGLVEESHNVAGAAPREIDSKENSIRRPQEGEIGEEPRSPGSPLPVIGTSTAANTGMAQSSGHVSPPTTQPTDCPPYPHVLYGKSPVDSAGPAQTRLSLPIWAFSGLPLPQQPTPGGAVRSPSHSSAQHSSFVLADSYDNSALEGSSLKRKKYSSLSVNRDTPILRTVLGQGHADSSQGLSLLRSDERYRTNGNGPTTGNENDRRNSIDVPPGSEAVQSPYTDVSGIDDDEKQHSPQSYIGDTKSGIVNYVPTPKPEWKRYKQYTRNDIMSAIEAVRSGMSALQAARKYGVPSRTLYDKVKKLGITTSRPFKRAGTNGSTACFPYGIGGNANGSIYGSGVGSSVGIETAGGTGGGGSSGGDGGDGGGVSGSGGGGGGGTPSEGENESLSGPLLENSSSAFEATNYVMKGRDHENFPEISSRCTPSPIPIRSMKQPIQHDDQVEDLSVNRKSDFRVIIPAASVIKEEHDVASESCNRN